MLFIIFLLYKWHLKIQYDIMIQHVDKNYYYVLFLEQRNN